MNSKKKLIPWTKNPSEDKIVFGRVLPVTSNHGMYKIQITDYEYLYSIFISSEVLQWINFFGPSNLYAKIRIYHIEGGWEPWCRLLSISTEPYPEMITEE